MKRMLFSLIMVWLFVPMAASQQRMIQGEVVSRKQSVDTDMLQVDKVTVVNHVPVGHPRYETEWLNFYNKTDDTLVVDYHVDVSLTRYERNFSYDFSLEVAPRDSMSDNTYSHRPVRHYLLDESFADSDCRAAFRLGECAVRR